MKLFMLRTIILLFFHTCISFAKLKQYKQNHLRQRNSSFIEEQQASDAVMRIETLFLTEMDENIGTSQNGNMFDFVMVDSSSFDSIRVTSIDINTASITEIAYEVWYRKGTYELNSQ